MPPSGSASELLSRQKTACGNTRRRPWLLPAAIITVLYGLLISLRIHKNLWYDELVTYYISKAPTLHQLFHLIPKWDENPPAVYLATRLSMTVFGDNIIAVRLPSAIEFYITGLMLFLYARRKLGYAYAAIPFLIFCYCPTFFRYSVEVRPYASLCMFFSVLLLCWDIATTERHRWALWGVAIANVGMLESHVFATLSLFAFFVAEFVRFRSTRKPDYGLWAALLIPTVLVVTYLPLFANFEPTLFPYAFQASPRRVPIFFWHALFPVALGLILAAALAWFVSKKKPVLGKAKGLRMADLALFATLLVNPILLEIAMIHRVFWDRYCLTTVLAIYVLIAALLAWRLRFNKYAGWTATVALTCLILVQRIALPVEHQLVHGSPPDYMAALARVRPDLPLVDASGVAFLQMDHYGYPEIVSRLYYLLGGSAAIEYAHATIFEGFGKLRQDFPIRATVERYPDFIRKHHEFLVFGAPWWPEDWLLKKLAADGARIEAIGEYPIPDYVGTTLYHVSVNRNGQGPARE